MTDASLRMLPSSIDAERSVLSAMLQRPEDTIPIVQEACAAGHFHVPAHKIIFRAVLDLHHERSKVDAVTVIQRLSDKGRLDEAGGHAYLLEIFTVAAPNSWLESHIAILSEKAALREIITGLSGATIRAYENDAATSVLEDVEGLSLQLRATHLANRKSELQSATDAVLDAIDLIEQKMEHARTTGLTGISTGFPKLDRLTSGLEKKTLTLVGARPSVGKTAFGISLLHKMCIQERLSVLYITLEGTREQIVMRLASQVAGVSVAKMKRGEASQATFGALEVVARAPLHIYRPKSMELLAMEAHVAARAYDIVFIDYLQKARIGNWQLREQITQIANTTKDWAERYDFAMIGLAQLARQSESEVRKPNLGDFKESSGLEEAADYAILLHRPDARKAVDENGDYIAMDLDCDLILAKNKDGSIGDVHCQFNRPLMQFEEYREESLQEEQQQELIP